MSTSINRRDFSALAFAASMSLTSRPSLGNTPITPDEAKAIGYRSALHLVSDCSIVIHLIKRLIQN